MQKFSVVLPRELCHTLNELAAASKVEPRFYVQEMVVSELASRRLPESSGGAQLSGSSDTGKKISEGMKLRWAARKAEV